VFRGDDETKGAPCCGAPSRGELWQILSFLNKDYTQPTGKDIPVGLAACHIAGQSPLKKNRVTAARSRCRRRLLDPCRSQKPWRKEKKALKDQEAVFSSYFSCKYSVCRCPAACPGRKFCFQFFGIWPFSVLIRCSRHPFFLAICPNRCYYILHPGGHWPGAAAGGR
jgi:hypothetical protein